MGYYILAIVEYKGKYNCRYEKDGRIFQNIDERVGHTTLRFEVGKETFLNELDSVEKFHERIRLEFIGQNIQGTMFVGKPMEFFQMKKNHGFIRRREMTYLKYDIDMSTFCIKTYIIFVQNSYNSDPKASFLEDEGYAEFLKEVKNGQI